MTAAFPLFRLPAGGTPSAHSTHSTSSVMREPDFERSMLRYVCITLLFGLNAAIAERTADPSYVGIVRRFGFPPAGQDLGARSPAQPTALRTSAPIFASSAGVNSATAYMTGQILPSSSFASSLKPRVEYLTLNLLAFWKKQTTRPSLA